MKQKHRMSLVIVYVVWTQNATHIQSVNWTSKSDRAKLKNQVGHNQICFKNRTASRESQSCFNLLRDECQYLQTRQSTQWRLIPGNSYKHIKLFILCWVMHMKTVCCFKASRSSPAKPNFNSILENCFQLAVIFLIKSNLTNWQSTDWRCRL